MWALSTSAGGTAYHHGDLHRSLIAAAHALLREGGAESVTLREAARRAGVSHNAPYRHFPSREALLAAVAAQGFRDLRSAQAAAAAAEPPDRLKAIGRAYLRFAAEDRAMFRLMFGGTLDFADHPDLAAAAGDAFGGLRSAVTRDEATADPGIVGRDALRAWALVHGLAHLVADRQIDAAQAEACLA